MEDSSNVSIRLKNIHKIANTMDRIYSKQYEENKFNYTKGSSRQNNHKRSRKRKRPRRHSSLDIIEIPIEKSKT